MNEESVRTIDDLWEEVLLNEYIDYQTTKTFLPKLRRLLSKEKYRVQKSLEEDLGRLKFRTLEDKPTYIVVRISLDDGMNGTTLPGKIVNKGSVQKVERLDSGEGEFDDISK